MSSSACLTSGCRPRSSKLGSFGSTGSLIRSEEVAVVSAIAAINIAAPVVSDAPFSALGIVSFVIERNLLVQLLSEIIQSERWSARGARIRRNQATSLVAAGRGTTENDQHVGHGFFVLAGRGRRRKS